MRLSLRLTGRGRLLFNNEVNMNTKYQGMTFRQIADAGHEALLQDDYIEAAAAYREAARVAAWPQDRDAFREAAGQCDRLALTLQKA